MSAAAAPAFVHLRVHTEYSLVDSVVRVPELADVPFPVKMEPHLVVEYYSS